MAVRIAIIDDHAHFRQALKSVLVRRQNYEIVGEAVDAAQGLELVKKTAPDLVLVDISLPRKSGLLLIGEIQECCPGIRIVILSILPEKKAALNMGADGFCDKEAGASELLKVIDDVIAT